MKVAFLIVICLLTKYQVIGQNQRQPFDKVSGNLLYLPQYDEIQGDPYLNNSWLKAKIIADNGTIFMGNTVKFDIYNNKFLFNRNDKAYEMDPLIKEVDVSSNMEDSNNKLIFKRGYLINPQLSSDKFIQVLSEGKISLFKYCKKEIEELAEFGNVTKSKRFKESNQFYILDEQHKYYLVSLNKKSLESKLSLQWIKVDQYLKNGHFSGKDEKSWRAAFIYYNSL